MSDYATAAALGSIAGTLDGMSLVATADKVFGNIAASRAFAQELQAERARFVQAYNELRNMAIDLQVANARLEAEVAIRDHEVAKRDTRLVNMEAEIFNRDEKIQKLEMKRRGDLYQIGQLLDAFNDYRDQLNIGTDKHDGAR